MRYRLAFVRRGEEKPAALYDNHSPKGHHRHVGGVEEPYGFVDIDHLIQRFGAGRWRKMKGDATIRFDDGTLQRAELHYP